MGYKVGDTQNLHSENYVREHGNRERTVDGVIPTPTVGHKGQEGSRSDFPDSQDHIAKVFSITEEDRGTVIRKVCSCGLEWSFVDVGARKNIFD